MELGSKINIGGEGVPKNREQGSGNSKYPSSEPCSLVDCARDKGNYLQGLAVQADGACALWSLWSPRSPNARDLGHPARYTYLMGLHFYAASLRAAQPSRATAQKANIMQEMKALREIGRASCRERV